ncbi:ninja-family protein AFP3-like [Typha angustifolia]|uniref:ninja-family protein AFP3-like n=1 Tax=Typha angustifolia TaxID=59011 RepID=UPI003C3098C0
MKEEAIEREKELFFARNGSYPRDFLQRFASNSFLEVKEEDREADSDEIELSLGLSLGGCYRNDPKGKKLVRSSSIAALPSENELMVSTGFISRTSSLPTENEEMRRKRKEMQSLKRLEVKRKRLERRNSAKVGEKMDEEVTKGIANGEIAARPTAAAVNCFPAISRSFSELQRLNFGSRTLRGVDISGLSKCTEAAKISLKVQSSPAHTNHRGETNTLRRITGKANNIGTEVKNMVQEMPCVSTMGKGPNGRRIEGFLYKYRKGEEVSIVCVCHGSFLTPAEFVKHAGGGDVTHPLRHIVVSPSASFL